MAFLSPFYMHPGNKVIDVEKVGFRGSGFVIGPMAPSSSINNGYLFGLFLMKVGKDSGKVIGLRSFHDGNVLYTYPITIFHLTIASNHQELLGQVLATKI
ncbi:MAG TPA: hypothetical protein VJ767_03845 [Nitrososphaeraceae archaeon]|nr:hypothetical protein [Nitrososphaeraceae archaeon]